MLQPKCRRLDHADRSLGECRMRFIDLVSDMPQAGLADFGMCLMMGTSKTGWSRIEAENEIAAGRRDGMEEVVVMEAVAKAVVVVKVEGEEEVVGIEVLV